MIIYENVVQEKGNLVLEFGSELIILFGNDAPEALREYCYLIDIKNTLAKIEKNQYFIIDNKKFKILGVGNIAEKNLVELGHLTVHFSGDLSMLLPGTIVVEKGECPQVRVGSKILIEE